MKKAHIRQLGCCYHFFGSKLRSEFIDEVIEGRNAWLESLSLSDLLNNLSSFAGSIEGISGDLLPMVEHTLREGSS